MEADGTNDVGASRRDLLKKAAAAGAIVWATPQVLANAASAAPTTGDRPWWCYRYPNHPDCTSGSTTTTSSTTTSSTTSSTSSTSTTSPTTTTPAPPGGKTICGSVRYTEYRVIKWHFVGTGHGQRVGAASFKSTKAHPAHCLGGLKLYCGSSHKTITNIVASGSETGVGSDNTNQNHGFTETGAPAGSGPYSWSVTPPSGWTLIAAGGELWGDKRHGEYKDGSDCNVRVSIDPNFPNNDGPSEQWGDTTYSIANNTFTATGYPHWVELVIAR